MNNLVLAVVKSNFDMLDESDIAETIAETEVGEVDPVDLFRSVGKAVGKLMTLGYQEDGEQTEVIDQETTASPMTATLAAATSLLDWDDMRVNMITKMCCQVGSMTSALLNENGGVSCEGSAAVYSKLVEETMKSKCFAAYTKCCIRPAE